MSTKLSPMDASSVYRNAARNASNFMEVVKKVSNQFNTNAEETNNPSMKRIAGNYTNFVNDHVINLISQIPETAKSVYIQVLRQTATSIPGLSPEAPVQELIDGIQKELRNVDLTSIEDIEFDKLQAVEFDSNGPIEIGVDVFARTISIYNDFADSINGFASKGAQVLGDEKIITDPAVNSKVTAVLDQIKTALPAAFMNYGNAFQAIIKEMVEKNTELAQSYNPEDIATSLNVSVAKTQDFNPVADDNGSF